MVERSRGSPGILRGEGKSAEDSLGEAGVGSATAVGWDGAVDRC